MFTIISLLCLISNFKILCPDKHPPISPTLQKKIAKMGLFTVRRADSCKMHLLIRERFVNATKAGVGQFSIGSLLPCQLVSARRLVSVFSSV